MDHCAEREKLQSAWTDRSNRVVELQEQRLAAVHRGDVSFHRFDSKIQKAQEAEAEAEQAYHVHLDQHGCSAEPGTEGALK